MLGTTSKMRWDEVKEAKLIGSLIKPDGRAAPWKPILVEDGPEPSFHGLQHLPDVLHAARFQAVEPIGLARVVYVLSIRSHRRVSSSGANLFRPCSKIVPACSRACVVLRNSSSLRVTQDQSRLGLLPFYRTLSCLPIPRGTDAHLSFGEQ
jgi:hypothetical protein